MRGKGGFSAPVTQGLAGWNIKQMNLKKRSREVSERKQVGDAESMVNEGQTSGRQGFFAGEGGEV
jgi:hypothetical protein